MYFSDVEKTGKTDSVEKSKSIPKQMTPPLGKWLYPKIERVAMQLILGGRVTYNYAINVHTVLLVQIKKRSHYLPTSPVKQLNCPFDYNHPQQFCSLLFQLIY